MSWSQPLRIWAGELLPGFWSFGFLRLETIEDHAGIIVVGQHFQGLSALDLGARHPHNPGMLDGKDLMKRQCVEDAGVPDYPTFSNFRKNRRDFLKSLGMGVAGLTLASCATEVSRDVPLPGTPLPPKQPGDFPPLGGEPVPPKLGGDIAVPAPPESEALMPGDSCSCT